MDVIYFFLTISALLGATIGSFLNVVILRGAEGKSLRGRSHCDSCKITLTPAELIPILNYLIQKGRCRNCDAALFVQYPLVEVATAILYCLSAWLIFRAFGVSEYSLALLLGTFSALAASIVIFVADIRYYLIPNGAVIILTITGLILAYITDQFLITLISAFTFALFFVALWFFSKGSWMGLGDAKLIFGTSLVTGFPESLSAFLLAFWTGAIFAATLWLLGKKGLGDKIPFGPFILIGAGLAFFLSDWLLYLTGVDVLLL